MTDSTCISIPFLPKIRSSACEFSHQQLELLASLEDIYWCWGPNGEWSGLGPGDSLLVTRKSSALRFMRSVGDPDSQTRLPYGPFDSVLAIEFQ